MPNKYSRFVTDFVRHFLFYKIQCFSICLNKISFKFTDKAPFFADLSVSKTHFTDEQVFSSNLSVNFCPLRCGFTDKACFLERLSVKLGSKLSKSYGQTAIFDHFVRNRHFWSKPFTDRRPIFIDVSVNDGDFANCSVC